MQPNNTNQKIIASLIIIVAIVLVTMGVNALNTKPQTTTTAVTTSQPAASTPTTSTPSTTQSTGTTSTTPTSASYKNGTYTVSSNYESPGGTEGITVSLTVQNDTVTASTIQNQSNNRDSQDYQAAFADSYKSYVVGQKLSDINLNQVSGSSLTSQGFDAALSQIKSQAQV